MAARLKGFLPLALVIGVLAFLYVEFALNFSFHWVTDGDLGNGLELPTNFYLVVPAAFVAWGMFFAAGGDNAAFAKVGIANVFGCAAALIMIILANATADLPDFWGISLWVGVMAGVLVALAALGDWYYIPATFGAFASVVFWWLATGLDGWAQNGGGVGNSVEALGDPATAGLGAFAGVLSTPYIWVSINILVTLTIGVALGLASAKIAAAITPKEKVAVEEKTGGEGGCLNGRDQRHCGRGGPRPSQPHGLARVEIRHSVELSGLEQTETVPALESIVLQFDHYGRLVGIEVTDAADSVLPPGLLQGA